MTTPEKIDWIIRVDKDPPLRRGAYRKWLESLNHHELRDYYDLVRIEYPQPSEGN